MYNEYAFSTYIDYIVKVIIFSFQLTLIKLYTL